MFDIPERSCSNLSCGLVWGPTGNKRDWPLRSGRLSLLNQFCVAMGKSGNSIPIREAVRRARPKAKVAASSTPSAKPTGKGKKDKKPNASECGICDKFSKDSRVMLPMCSNAITGSATNV